MKEHRAELFITLIYFNVPTLKSLHCYKQVEPYLVKDFTTGFDINDKPVIINVVITNLSKKMKI